MYLIFKKDNTITLFQINNPHLVVSRNTTKHDVVTALVNSTFYMYCSHRKTKRNYSSYNNNRKLLKDFFLPKEEDGLYKSGFYLGIL